MCQGWNNKKRTQTNGNWKKQILKALLKSEGCHDVLSSFFNFTSSRSWWQYPRATLYVIHNIASCLSLFTAVVSVKSSFSPLRHILWGQHPRVCISARAQHTPVVAKIKVFRDVSLKACKVFLPISHLNKCNRIWFSPGNHGYLHPHYLWDDKTQCCSVWNGADKDSLSPVCAAESALAPCCLELSVITWYCSIWYLH